MKKIFQFIDVSLINTNMFYTKTVNENNAPMENAIHQTNQAFYFSILDVRFYFILWLKHKNFMKDSSIIAEIKWKIYL